MLRIKDVFIINSRLVLIELHFYWPNNTKQRFDKRGIKITAYDRNNNKSNRRYTKETDNIHITIYYEKRIF
jgi:hypothetical protein